MPEQDLSASTESPSSLSGWVAALVKAIAAEGVNPSPLLAQAGIAEDVLLDAEGRVAIANMKQLWRLAVEATGNSAIGLQVPRYLTSASLFAIGSLLEVAPTFQEGIRNFINYQPVISTAIEVSCDALEQDQYLIRVDVKVSEDMPEAEDALVSALVSALVTAMPQHLTILKVSMIRPEPEQTAIYRQRLCETLEFSQPSIAIQFHCSSEVMGKPVVANPVLENAIQSVLDDYVRRMADESLLTRVRGEIILLMKDEEPSLECVAQRFHMSGRTLQRKLEAKGTGYRQLLDEARRELALELVGNTNSRITDIALRLGFRNASNFARAFKRWSGVTPGEFRSKEPGR
ncbi:MAG: AraC family transcriptional regulator ligand-binding domain-containing protein [Pseudomonadota bacterium]|nr:AraC family transcriptional regulator ligand-binding domain-containing protein [Pseudomonadota bacterium]